MKKSTGTSYIAFGLIAGSIIGLFLDMYQIDLYGAVGLGIVYTPMIGLSLAIIICRWLNKKSGFE